MSDDVEEEVEAPKKGGKLGLIVGLVLALVGGGGTFFAVYSGMLLGGAEETAHVQDTPGSLPPVAFVPIEPMLITLGPNAGQQLRFKAELEVDPALGADVSHLMPRILDVLNGYLRAVEVSELKDPRSLSRLRAQMLRRVQLVTGRQSVRDLLITEFVFG